MKFVQPRSPCSLSRNRNPALFFLETSLPLSFYSMLCTLCAGATASHAAATHPLNLDAIRVRDPFIYADTNSQTYFLYAQTGNRLKNPQPGLGVEVYWSKDLEHWSEPALAFRRPEGFWGGDEIWAPEVHRFGDKFYLFVSFNGRQGGRGTQIFHSDSPAGPFTMFSEAACTPPEQCSLDGTPWVDADGTNWLVYCHEWVQVGDGRMLAVRMKPDWSARVGEPIVLFTASQSPWVNHLESAARPGTNNFVTDGPFLYRTRSGQLRMLWSSFGRSGYGAGVAVSRTGRIEGPWVHLPDPLFARDGGHGMMFKAFDGQQKLVLHQPNGGGKERAQLFEVEEINEQLRLRRSGHAGYLFAYMSGDDYWHLRYAISRDGLKWKTLNGNRRISEEYIGHPDICRGHDRRFYLIGNIAKDRDIRLWVSTNLVSWAQYRDLRPDPTPALGPGHSGDHGAPKIYFDEATRTFLISWHTSVTPPYREDPEAYWRGQRTLYVTSRDLVTFSEPRRLFEHGLATIDTIVRREDNRYFAIFKDERYPSFDWPTGKSIRVAIGENLTGPFGSPSAPISANFHEAPTLIPRPDGQGWFLYCEQYPGVSYSLSTATTLDGSWYNVSWGEYSTPTKARHGCMIELGDAEWKSLTTAFDRP